MSKTPPDPIDPDAEGLPIDIELPDRGEFRAGQAWAMLVISFVALIVLLLWWSLQPYSRIVAVCAAVAGCVFVFNVARWLIVRRSSQAGR